ncbi:transposable element Tcb1 transposase [Trichonephila clavipes]|nr:transposable element Tcb1 transposase [Trichonephila clavipes]
MSRRKQRSAFDQVYEFDRGRIVVYRDIVAYLSEKSVVVLDEIKQLQCGYVTAGEYDEPTCSIASISVHHFTTTDVSAAKKSDERRISLAEGNEVVFTDKSRICLQLHDGPIRVRRHRGERMLNRCVMHRHTGPAPGIMVWGGICYLSRTPIVRITGTLNSQYYISKVLEPVVLPYLQGLVTAIFQQDNARPYVARIVQRFLSITRWNCFPGRLALRIFRR